MLERSRGENLRERKTLEERLGALFSTGFGEH